AYYLQPKRNKAKVHYHVLQPGEDLWTVSQKFGVKLSKLKQKNRIEDDEALKPGRVLWLRFIRPEHIPVEYRHVEAVAAKTSLSQKESAAFDKPAESLDRRESVEAKKPEKPAGIPVNNTASEPVELGKIEEP